METGDLIAYGLIPEFVGRFPILVSLSSLNEDQLVQVCSISSMVVSRIFSSWFYGCYLVGLYNILGMLNL